MPEEIVLIGRLVSIGTPPANTEGSRKNKVLTECRSSRFNETGARTPPIPWEPGCQEYNCQAQPIEWFSPRAFQTAACSIVSVVWGFGLGC